MPTADLSFGDGISEELRATVTQWFQWDRNEESRQWVSERAAAGDAAALHSAFGARLDFGTAGLRGKMAPGCSCMNDLVIIQTSQGLVQYLKQMHAAGKCGSSNLSLVVGYDARYNSERWAKLIGCVCAEAGVLCHLFTEALPTPMVAFAVNKLKAAGGVVVTASHNPPQDNGYKVYWCTGSQIIPPHDSGIKKAISENMEPWSEAVWDYETKRDEKLILDPTEEMCAEYIRKVSFSDFKEANASPDCPQIVYTPVHGVGRRMIDVTFADFGFRPPIVPEEQAAPDPSFPTTSFPNPEEAGVLDISMRCAEKNGAKLVFANDPDADRLCVAELQPDGTWYKFSGNELGSLLGWWAFEIRDKSKSLEDCVMIASTVSSHFLKGLGDKEGFKFEETLTGFKWMGSRAAELQAEGKTVLFMFEEAIGFVFGISGINDKDGVATAAYCAELCRSCYKANGNLLQKLHEIFDLYGWYVQNNGYYFCHDKPVIASIFARLRGWDACDCAEFQGDRAAPAGRRYPKAAGRFAVAGVRDLTVGYDSSFPGGAPMLPTTPETEMITFSFENKAVVTLRTSGTEPKIKWYSDLAAKSAAEANAEIAEMLAVICREWLEPEKNGLKPATGS